MRIYKKNSGTPSVAWNDCVVSAIAWGWIDGLRKSLDDVSFLQRLTPRKPKSGWSAKNREHAERLIAGGSMHASGLDHVDRARKDGRWDAAYEGSRTMVMPPEFLKELRKHPAAKKIYATLNRTNLFAIYLRIHTAKRPETKVKRMAAIIAQLERGESYH